MKTTISKSKPKKGKPIAYLVKKGEKKTSIQKNEPSKRNMVVGYVVPKKGKK